MRERRREKSYTYCPVCGVFRRGLRGQPTSVLNCGDMCRQRWEVVSRLSKEKRGDKRTILYAMLLQEKVLPLRGSFG